MIPLINFVSAFSLMMVTGIFWGPWFALTRSLKIFDAGEFIKITKILSANLGTPMRFMLPGCILLMGLALWADPQKNTPAFYLGISALLLIISSLVVTVAVEVPIVKSVEQWDLARLPSDWMTKRDRWLKFHVIRMVTSLASFGCFVLGVLILR